MKVGTFFGAHQEELLEGKIQRGIHRGSSGGIEAALLNSGDNSWRAQNHFDGDFTGQRERLLEFLKLCEVEARQIGVDDRLMMGGRARGGNGHDDSATM